jgi:hypothetical protein
MTHLHIQGLTFTTLLAFLVFAHFLADFPLQGDFLASAKRGTVTGVPWWLGMLAHAWIQAGFVLLLTRSIACFCGELLMHFAIDTSKTRGQLGWVPDQALHVGCKVLWALIIAVYGVR